MKVLLVTPYLPYPLFSGGQVRLFNLIKNLSSKHEITLFSFIRKEGEREHLPELLKYCRKVEVFKKRKPWMRETLFKAVFSTYPLLMAMYDFPQFKERVRQELGQNNYDLIHVECFYVMHDLPKNPRLPVVLVEQNIEYLVYQRFIKNFKWAILKPLMYFDVLKIKFWEKYYWQRVQKLVAMSKEEEKLMEQVGVEIVPNGVDTKFFRQKIVSKNSELTVVFVGNFRWIQNKDAVRFLYSEVWPHIIKELPNTKFLVVGRDIPKRLREFLGSGVIIEEDIEDIREAYQKAHLLLAPVRVGGGTSYKILEAMASGLPVVTTSLGIEGIEATDGKEVIVRDSPEEIAKAVVDLLKNERRRKEIGQKAQKLMEEKYDWEKISTKLSRIWEEVSSL